MGKKRDLEFLQAVAGLSGVEVAQARVEKGDSKPKKRVKDKSRFQNRIKVPSK